MGQSEVLAPLSAITARNGGTILTRAGELILVRIAGNVVDGFPKLIEVGISPGSGFVDAEFVASYGMTGAAAATAIQWFLDGAAIAGATAPYYRAAAPGALTFKVIATNVYGTDSAESLAVIVRAQEMAPAITSLGISPAAGRVGTAFTAGVTVTGNPASTISRRWRLGGADIAGATVPPMWRRRRAP